MVNKSDGRLCGTLAELNTEGRDTFCYRSFPTGQKHVVALLTAKAEDRVGQELCIKDFMMVYVL